MTKIKHLEMGQTIANHPHIRIAKSFFGMSESIVYEPTNSRVRLVGAEYDPADGVRLQRLLAMPTEKMSREIAEHGVPEGKTIGNFRLEGAVSSDQQFVALQLFQFVDFRYTPVSEPLCYEGERAKVVANLIWQN